MTDPKQPPFRVVDASVHSLTLSSAILLYSRARGGPYYHGNSVQYATIHPVGENGPNGTPMIDAGVPITREAIHSIFSCLAKGQQRKRGVMPPEVLSIGADYVMWWCPPATRTVYFNTREAEGATCVGKRAGKAPCPGIIFIASGNEMYAYAVKGNDRPTSDTSLHHAPLMNVWENAKVCVGSMPLPDETLGDSIGAWERSFWDSYFTHPNQTKATNYPGGLHALWNALLDGKHKTFPVKALRRMGKRTVSDLIAEWEEK